jgi:hypothetical protein
VTLSNQGLVYETLHIRHKGAGAARQVGTGKAMGTTQYTLPRIVACTARAVAQRRVQRATNVAATLLAPEGAGGWHAPQVRPLQLHRHRSPQRRPSGAPVSQPPRAHNHAL